MTFWLSDIVFSKIPPRALELCTRSYSTGHPFSAISAHVKDVRGEIKNFYLNFYKFRNGIVIKSKSWAFIKILIKFVAQYLTKVLQFTSY